MNCSLGVWEVQWGDKGPCELKFGKYCWGCKERWFCLLFIVPSFSPFPKPLSLSIFSFFFHSLLCFLCLSYLSLPSTSFLSFFLLFNGLNSRPCACQASYTTKNYKLFERGSHYIDQAGLELTDICHSPAYLVLGLWHYTQLNRNTRHLFSRQQTPFSILDFHIMLSWA